MSSDHNAGSVSDRPAPDQGVDFVGNRDLNKLLGTRAEIGGECLRPEDSSDFVGWRELAEQVQFRSGLLLNEGILPGSRVALYQGTSLEAIVNMLALYGLGVTVVMANTHYTLSELTFLLKDSEAAALIVDADERRLAIATDVGASHGTFPRVLRVDGSQTFLVPLRTKTDRLETSSAVGPHSPATLIYTAGSTARPKGVLYTHGNHVFAAETMARSFGLLPGDLILHHFPIFHTNGLCQLFTALVCGHRILLRGRFRSSSFRELVEEAGVNFTFLNPTQTRMVLSEDSRLGRGVVDHPSLKFVGTAGIDRISRAQFEKTYRTAMIECYGSTETIAICCANPLSLRRHGSCGLPTSGYEMRLDPPAPKGSDVPGRLFVRSTSSFGAFPGYWGAVVGQDSPPDSGDWYDTGDGAFQDSDGYFYFAGRSSDVIKRGGENISAFEIEHVIGEHPSVEDVAVVAMADELRDELPIAFVVLKPDAHFESPGEIETRCRELLAYFKVPSEYRYVKELPRLGTGKVDKVRLRQIANDDLSESRG